MADKTTVKVEWTEVVTYSAEVEVDRAAWRDADEDKRRSLATDAILEMDEGQLAQSLTGVREREIDGFEAVSEVPVRVDRCAPRHEPEW